VLVQAQHHEWRAARRPRADERREGGAAEDVVARLAWVRGRVRVRFRGRIRVRVRVTIRVWVRVRVGRQFAPRQGHRAAGSIACKQR